MKLIANILLSVMVLGTSTASAEIILSIGNVTFQPNSPSPIIEIPLIATSNNFALDQVTGFNLRAQIGDGVGGEPEPVFSAIIFSETIWNAFPNSFFGGPIENFQQFAQASVLFSTPGHQVAANGVVARLFVDTTGFLDGSFPVMLFGTQIGQNSEFIGQGGATIAPMIVNGSITAVPEPNSFMLACFGMASLVTYRRARQRDNVLRQKTQSPRISTSHGIDVIGSDPYSV